MVCVHGLFQEETRVSLQKGFQTAFGHIVSWYIEIKSWMTRYYK